MEKEIIAHQNKEIRELKAKIRNLEDWKQMELDKEKARRHQKQYGV